MTISEWVNAELYGLFLHCDLSFKQPNKMFIHFIKSAVSFAVWLQSWPMATHVQIVDDMEWLKIFQPI